MSNIKINLGISFAIATLAFMVVATIGGGINNANALLFDRIAVFSPTTQTATSAIGQDNQQQQTNDVASGGLLSPNTVGLQSNLQHQTQFADSSAKNINKCCDGIFIKSPTTQTATSAVGQTSLQIQANSVTSTGATSPNTVGVQSNIQGSSQVAYSDARNVLTSGN